MPTLTVIAGCSGSGKSAVKPILETQLKSHHLVDFDDIGVPEDDDTVWQQTTTEAGLKQLNQQKKPVILLGQVVLGELVASPSFKRFDEVTYIFLDVSDEQRLNRLSSHAPSLCNQDTLNWSAWQRMHVNSLKWQPSVITDNAWQGCQFKQWLSTDSWDELLTVKTIDTTDLSLAQLAHRIHSLLTGRAQVIYLNGPTSVGKSTLTHELQARLPGWFLHLGIDKCIGMMPETANNWQSDESCDGFYWQFEHNQAGQRLAFLQQGALAKAISQSYPKLCVAMLNQGFNLIIDDVSLSLVQFQEWQTMLAPFQATFVGLTASDEVLAKREQARGDRVLGSAIAQNQQVHQGKTYDLVLDMTSLSTKEAASLIIQQCF